MTALILLAMFSFVVLPTISSAMRQGPGMSDPVLAEVDGVKLSASRVGMFTRQHYSTIQFLQRLAQESIKRGSTPQVPGFNVNPQTGDIQGLGINMAPSDEMSIRTLQFAAEAQRQGLELDDTSIELWLDQFTGGTISQRDVFALLRKETGNKMGQPQLFDMLRKQLLSSLYFRGSDATIGSGQAQTLSPLDHWRNFLKLNQNASIQAYGVLVSDYIDETDENPSGTEIDAVYEEGKDRYSSRESSEPGFRRRPTASFEYLMAELQKFRDAELAKLPEEAIREEYERRLKGGDFVLPDLPTEEEPASEEPASEESMESEATEETPEGEAPENADAADGDAVDSDLKQVEDFAKELEEAGNLEEPAMKEGDAGAEAKTAEPETAEPESTEPEPETADEKMSEPATEGETGNSETEAGEPEPETSEPETEAGELESEGGEPEAEGGEPEAGGEPGEGDQSSMVANAVRLVTQNDEPQAEEEAAETPAQESEAPAQEGEAAEAEAGDDSSETAADDAEADADESESNVMAFEEVKDQIARSMVEPAARAALDKALTSARNQMRSYYQKVAISNDKDLERPDLKKLADELGLTYRVIGPHDPVTLADEPIASAVEEGTEFSRRGMPFTAKMFGVEGQVPEQPLFRPVVFVQIETERSYLCWKTEATEAFTPELDEVRDEVVDAIRMVQARKLALEAAEDIAAKANEGEALDSLIPEGKKDNFKKDIKPFTWLNTVGFAGITLGNVEELDSVGEDFMKAVFTELDDKYVVAENLPGRVVYVIKRVEMQPTASELKSVFKQPTERLLPQFMTDGSLQKVRQGFYEAVDEKTGFEYLGGEE
ncbi:MAG: hypothetical protein AAFX06_13565 [Planctomycetota bacterium]